MLSSGAGLAYDLMIAAGRAADGMITSSRQRLLEHRSGEDFEGAALEKERHLRVLHYMGRLADCGGAPHILRDSASDAVYQGKEMRMPAEVFRLFLFARHAESAANAAHVLSSDPSRPVALTARGRVQARVLGAQLANVPVDLAVGTRLLRTRQTIDIALHGRQIPVLIEPGFDELQAGELDGAPIQAAPDSRFPHGESPADALRRHANALRRLLARTETVTLVVIHEFALRHIAMAAAAGG